MTKVHYYEGTEHLELNGRMLPYTMIDFWRMKLSCIMETMTRGSFAEFLVACALEEHGIPAFQQDKDGVDAWDLDGPEIMIKGETRPIRIEVKSTANVHINLPAEERQLTPSQLKFSIREADHEGLGKCRHSDIYVFCYYKATKKSQNMLDVGLWEFYVVPTAVINEKCGENKSISLSRIKNLGYEAIPFTELKETIDMVLT